VSVYHLWCKKRIILCIKKKGNNWIKIELFHTHVYIYLSIRNGGGGGGKKALVFVANGSEDIEVVATVDILRRGGIDVKLCSVEKNDKNPLTCANNI